MKKFIFSVAALFASVSLWAEEPQAEPSPGTMAGSAGITGSQMTLTNWAAGGDPSVAANFHAIYDDEILSRQSDGASGRCLQLQEVAGVGLLVKF